jgi:amino-acid N-acetyltransferase
MAFNNDHIKWFRDSSPYIDAHRGRTFVLCLASPALVSENLTNIISDIALLNSLGVRIVLVFDATDQIEPVTADSTATQLHRTVTSPELISNITSACGRIASDLCAHLGSTAPDSPMGPRDITAVTGNYIKAKPIGIVDGVDYQLSGETRSINRSAITHHLDGNEIVILPPVGYSPSGETFYLDAQTLARDTACAINADKLIYMTADAGLNDSSGKLISEIDLSNYDPADIDLHDGVAILLSHSDHACHKGVARCHIISFKADGAILEELFTRDGCGTQIIGHSYEQIRPATIDDVPGILKLIEPLEAAGVLVKRSRELLESEISQFVVIERDGLLISCAALYQYDTAGELACLVTHPDYRNGDRGDRLLANIENTARKKGLKDLFVLTTQSADWFSERGFTRTDLDNLPKTKQDFYNYQRSSKILIKAL